MIRLLRDSLDVRIRRMLGRSAERPSRKVERALRSGCVDCPATDVQPVYRDTIRCAAHYEKHRLANASDRRKRGIRARVVCPCGVAGHYPINCETGGVPAGATT